MNQRDWFQMIEQEQPGLLRRVWEDYKCLCTAETNAWIARDLTIHARLRGDDVKITVAGWRHYRTTNGFVSWHRQKKTEDSSAEHEIPPEPVLALEEPPQTIALPVTLQAVYKLYTAIERQTAATERLNTILEAWAERKSGGKDTFQELPRIIKDRLHGPTISHEGLERELGISDHLK